jgi:hypothetical protein
MLFKSDVRFFHSVDHEGKISIETAIQPRSR